MIIAIDPGVAGRGCACASAHPHSGVLEDAWFERPVRGGVTGIPHAKGLPPRLGQAGSGGTLVLVERPVYEGERSEKARTQDLLALAWEGALMAGEFAGRDQCPIIEMPPSDMTARECPFHGIKAYRKRDAPIDACCCLVGWKGSEPKPRMHARVWDVLSYHERMILGGRATEKQIRAAVAKGALDRWSRPGVEYYPRSWDGHNLLDVASMIAVYTKRIKRAA